MNIITGLFWLCYHSLSWATCSSLEKRHIKEYIIMIVIIVVKQYGGTLDERPPWWETSLLLKINFFLRLLCDWTLTKNHPRPPFLRPFPSCWTHDQKLLGSDPGRSSWRLFFTAQGQLSMLILTLVFVPPPCHTVVHKWLRSFCQ